MRIRFGIGLLIALAAVAPSRGETPLSTAFTYQGQLKESGAPFDGTADFVFTLWDAAGSGDPPTGGTQVGGAQAINALPVTAGLFTITLNAGGEFGGDAFDGNTRWLQVEVRSPAGGGAFITLAPRQPLTAAPQALFAVNAATADTATTAANTTQLNGQPAAFYQNASNINSGTLADARLSNNVALLNAAQTFSAGKTFLAAPSFTAAGSPFSVTSTALVVNLNADKLDGLDSSAFLQSVPVPLTLIGASASHVIRGENITTAHGASGVYGLANFPIYETYGVRGRSESTSGFGVFGEAPSTTGVTYGGRFESASIAGRGVLGWAVAATGTTYGVVGQTASTDGRGVLGLATATSGTIYGVYGQASTAAAGYAVFADGDMGASGVKPFRIDHPDDPANKYLLHYAAESPEVINFYSGKATLDGAGQAVVELPHYFAKINKDPRYTLTAVGAPMPMLHVAAEIDEAALSAGATAGPGETAPVCSFRIAGGAPGAKVSWEVKALRNDLWVRNRAEPVEVEKQGREKGTYQHPEFYGMTAEMGMNYVASTEAAPR